MADTTPPGLISVSPTDNATDAPANGTFTLTFNETIVAGTGEIVFFNINGTVARRISILDATQVTLEPTRVLVKPAEALQTGREYYIGIASGVILDTSGNAFIGINGVTSYNFRIAGDDFPDSAATLQSIPINSQINGVLGIESDVDFFRVDLKAEENYALTLSRFGLGGLTQPLRLSLHDATGKLITSVDSAANNPGEPARLIVSGPATATYYLSATGAQPTIGSYVLAVNSVADDFPDANTTTGRVLPDGIAVVGTTQFAGDADRFRIDLEANTPYRFTLTPTGTQEVRLQVVDSSGQTRFTTVSGQPGAVSSQFLPAEAGSYYVRASAVGEATGGYRITATVEDDHSGDPNAATALTIGSEVVGQIGFPGDRDLFRVDLQLGQTYLFRAAPTGASQAPPLSLLGPGGAVLASGENFLEGGNNHALIAYTPQASGFYFVAAGGVLEQPNVGYRVSATRVTDDFSDDSFTTGRVVVDGPVVGGMFQFAGDIDRFQVDLSAGVTYRFTATSEGAPLLRVIGPGGAVLASAQPGTPNQTQLSFAPAANGSYFVSTRFEGSTTRPYEVSAARIPDDHPVGSPGRLTAGAPATIGTVDAIGDTDRYDIDLLAGQVYIFTLAGAATGQAPNLIPAIPDPLLELFGPDGKLIASNDDVGLGSKDSQITVVITDAGLYSLIARDDAGSTGGYAIRGRVADFQGPRLLTMRPVDGAEQIARNTEFELTFDEPIESGFGSIEFREAVSGTLVRRIDIGDRTQVTFGTGADAAKLRIASTVDLAANGRFYVTLDGAAVRDGAGNPYAGLVSSTGYDFTTAPDDYDSRQTTPAEVTSDGRTTAGLVEVRGDVDLFKITLASGLPYEFTLAGNPAVAAAGRLQSPTLVLHRPDFSVLRSESAGSNGDIAFTLTPSEAGVYFLEVRGDGTTSGAYALRAHEVEQVAPLLATRQPAANQPEVARSANIVLTFNEPIRAGSGAISVFRSDGTLVEAFNVAGSPRVTISDRTLTVDPTLSLGAGSFYVEVAANAVLDLSSNPFAGLIGRNAYVFSTTASNRAPTAAGAALQTSEDTRLQGQLPTGSDPDDDSVTYAVFTPPEHGTLQITPAGAYDYRPAADYNGSDRYTFEVRDGLGGSNRYEVSIAIAPVFDRFVGTDGPDRMPGYAGADSYDARGGDDIITPGAGDDEIDAGPGTDTVVLSGARAGFTIQRSVIGLIVSSATQGRDVVGNAERLLFDNQALAFDVGGRAGTAARIVGTLLGPALVSSPELMGLVIGLLDRGVSTVDLVAAGLQTPQFLQVAGSASNADLVSALFRNVAGVPPSAEQLQTFTAALDAGAISRAGLATLAAELDITAVRVNLVGLGETGIVYVPLP